MNFEIDNIKFKYLNVSEIDGEKGILYKKIGEKKKLFLPFSSIKSVDSKCINSFFTKYRLVLFLIVIITIFLTQNIKVILILLPFFIWFAITEFFDFYKVKMVINVANQDIYIILHFDSIEDSCEFAKILQDNGIKGIKNKVKHTLFKVKKIIKFT